MCLRVPVLRWSLQFLVRIFTFLSLILCYYYYYPPLTGFKNIKPWPESKKSEGDTHYKIWDLSTKLMVLRWLHVVFDISDAANNSSTPPLLDYTEFYNSALDHMDLMQDYFNWQSPQRTGQFSYCQYPFILSIVAKRIILTKVIFHFKLFLTVSHFSHIV